MGGVTHAPHVHRPTWRGWSHAVGFVVLTVLGVVLLGVSSAPPRYRFTLSIYVVGILTMFGVSALYHRGPWGERGRAFWQRLDHCTIFLAIAGTYTPVAVAGLHGWQRVAVLTTVWSGAVLGIALQWLPLHIPRPVFTIIYVIVGWSLGIALPQLFRGLGGVGFGLILAGGIAYTLGAVVYALKRPDPWPRTFGFHEVFHLLTVIGAGLHLAAIAFVVDGRLGGSDALARIAG